METKRFISTGLMVCYLVLGVLIAGPLGNAYATEKGNSTQQWNCCPKSAQSASNCVVMSGWTEPSQRTGSGEKQVTLCCERCSEMKPDEVAWQKTPGYQEDSYNDLLF